MLKENLVLLRGARGMSQEQVAEAIGISRQAYAKWEKGETVPDVEKCQKLAQLYDTTIDALLKTETHEAHILLPAPKGKHIWGTVTVGERGNIVIPKDAREAFHIVSGTRLVVLGEDHEGIALIPAELFEERLKKIYQHAAEKIEE